MDDIIKQLMPVCIEAIKTGKTLGIWYLLTVSLIPLVKTLINWIFALIILKGAYSLVLYIFGSDNEKN